MSGTIEVAEGAEWSAATWLYEWALKIVAEHAHTPNLARRLRDAIDSNFGWVKLSDYPPGERREVAEVLRTHLVSESEQRLPETVPNRDEVIRLLADLVDMAEAVKLPPG